MNSLLLSLAAGALAVFAIMCALWWLGIRHRNFSYVDIGWCANFAVLAAIGLSLGEGSAIRKWIIAGMYAIWSLRLAWHLAQRIVGQPEEGRYVELRRQWGADGNLNWKFFVFFQFQAALNLILAVPLLLASRNASTQLHALEIAGIVLWIVAVCGESLADAQLASFKRNPANKGEVCNVGLWRYSRHPNYFFEWLIWVAYAVFALPSSYGWIALGMPALMLHFLINVTGVRATEEQAVRSKGDKYRRYQHETSMFVPLPPKRPRDRPTAIV
jgi:steroid 5-alpha reductase family enzyme